MSTAHSVIETIVNGNFGNKFQHQNGPNQQQHIYKILVNSINPYPFKGQGPHKFHNWKKTALGVD